MSLRDRRITTNGIINIKAQRSRSQDKNRIDALRRFTNLIMKGLTRPKPRKKNQTEQEGA